MCNCFNAGKRQDDLVEMLAKEPDFSAAKPLLQEKLEAIGCKVIFGVKFHPELMMIESCYRYSKNIFSGQFIKISSCLPGLISYHF